MPKPQNQDLWGKGYHHLIDAVKPHKALYCKYHPMFNNKRYKLQLWQDVCKVVVPGWNEMTLGEKGEKLNEVQRGWKTVRDGFSRELHNQRKDKERKEAGEEVRKRKKYGYFLDLLFLLDGKDIDEEDVDISADPLGNSTYENEDSDSDEQTDTTPFAFAHTSVKKTTKKKKFKSEPKNSSDEDVPDIPKKVKSNIEGNKELEEKNGIDDDKHFCLSLVPSFKKMTDKQKFEARIAILQIMGDISFRAENVDTNFTHDNDKNMGEIGFRAENINANFGHDNNKVDDGEC